MFSARLALTSTIAAMVLQPAITKAAQAQEPGHPQIRAIAPGTEIAVSVNGTTRRGQYVVLSDDDSNLTVLKLTAPDLPDAAKKVLRDIATRHPDYLASADRHGSFVHGDITVTPDGIFISDRKVADVDEVVDHVRRADLVEVTGLPLTVARPTEISIGIGGIASFLGSGGDVRVSFSVPRNESRSLEGFVGVYRGQREFLDTQAVYGLQQKRLINKGRRPGVEPFWTIGLMGAVVRYDSYDCVYASCGRHTSSHLLPPVLFLLGAGTQHTISPKLALRLDVQAGIALFLPVGVRVSAAASVPLGRGSSAARSR